MKTLIKQIDELSDFREALKQWVAAKEEAVVLESDAKKVRAQATLAHLDTNHKERWARIDLDAEAERVAAELAKAKAVALYHLAVHLRGADHSDES